MHRGYIKLWRKINDHPLHPSNRSRDWSGFEALLDLISTAHSKDEPKRVLINNKTMEIKRGELDVTTRQLASRWRWSPAKTNRFLNYLKVERSIDINVNAKFSVITILNYDIYNPINERLQKKSETPTKRQRNASETLINEGKEGNEVNKEINKKSFGKFVSLFDSEVEQLTSLMGKDGFDAMIVTMNDYCSAVGKEYKDYAAAMRNWWRKEHPIISPDTPKVYKTTQQKNEEFNNLTT